jgi:hypothetical protein
MTAIYVTAGLEGQDTSVGPSLSTAAWLTAGLAASDLPHTGYRLYVMNGSLAEADFQTSGAMLIPAGRSSDVYLAGDFAASSLYTLVLRPVIDDAETPDMSCRLEFETDPDAQWLGLRPCRVEALTAEQLSAGRVSLSWTYRTPERAASPEGFCVYYASDAGITAGDPQAVVSYAQDGAASCTLSLVGGQTYYFAVTARGAGGVESRLSPVVGPVVADSLSPMSPPVILTTTF